MSFREQADASFLFSINGVRERMKEKKNGALKTAKLNASLAAKIRTKTINNSSIIKVSLKQNNKALALALNAAKTTVQRLTHDKMLLQKEVELCHFENASLRQKLSSVNKCIEELHLFMNSHLPVAMKLSRPSENGSCSLSPSDGRQSATDDKQDDNNHPVRAAPIPMRIPLSHVDDDDCKNGRGIHISMSLQMPPSGVPASDKSQKSVFIPSMEKSSSFHLIDEPLSNNEEGGRRLTEVDVPASELDLGIIFGDNPSNVSQSSRSCSLSSLNRDASVQQSEETTRLCSDSVVLSQGHVTTRKKQRSGLSARFRDDSQVELSDDVPVDGQQCTKEMEPAAIENLEVSQVGELLTLRDKNKNYQKIKANETKALRKVSTGAKNGDSFICQSKKNVDCCTNGGMVINATVPFKESGTTKLISQNEDSTRVDVLEEIKPLDERGQSDVRSSKHFDKTTSRRTYVVGLAPPNLVDDCDPLTQGKKRKTFVEKLKNLESLFHSPEHCTLSDKIHQDEKSYGCDMKRTSQCFDKARGCSRICVVDPAPPGLTNNCASFTQEIKKSTNEDNLEDVRNLSQSSGSSSLSNKAPLDAFCTQQPICRPKQIPSQEETLSLNVKRKKAKTQETSMPRESSEADEQNLEGNVLQALLQENKPKRVYKSKIAKADRNNAQKEQSRTSFDVSDVDKRTVKGNKRKYKDLTGSTKSTNQANETSLLPLLGIQPSTFPVLLDGEKTPLDGVCRKSTKSIQKVQGSSMTQKRALNKTNVSSERTCWGVNSHVVDIKKREDSKPKVSRRTYTVSDMMEEHVASDVALQHSEGSQTSQADKAKWSFLCVPGSRTQQDSFLVDITETPLLDSLAVSLSTPDLSLVDSSKTLSGSRSSGNSCSLFQAAKDLANPERSSALPKTLAVLNQNNVKQAVFSKHEKTTKGAPENLLQNTVTDKNEHNVLKDLTNASPDSCDCVLLEESSTQPNRRRRKPVCYIEPKLNSKLRRGDPFTVTDFLRSPVYKTKTKKLTKQSEDLKTK